MVEPGKFQGYKGREGEREKMKIESWNGSEWGVDDLKNLSAMSQRSEKQKEGWGRIEEGEKGELEKPVDRWIYSETGIVLSIPDDKKMDFGEEFFSNGFLSPRSFYSFSLHLYPFMIKPVMSPKSAIVWVYTSSGGGKKLWSRSLRCTRKTESKFRRALFLGYCTDYAGQAILWPILLYRVR